MLNNIGSTLENGNETKANYLIKNWPLLLKSLPKSLNLVQKILLQFSFVLKPSKQDRHKVHMHCIDTEKKQLIWNKHPIHVIKSNC